ncbi:toxin, RelE family protein [Steroidobacter agaridevorans]|uniref:Toxin, RelE family protein n=1 Tax=Steroidobacter agaridevorans TaxID=2695856 RepID=A0A829YJH2_9GAMM|nr:toxin, RelE family protein [Steroidobacter agaridevorans]
MLEIFRSETFDRWLLELRDPRARARIEARILRLSRGNPGDVKPVGSGVSEMRIDHGRVIACTSHDAASCWFFFCAAATSGHSKRTQQADIERAIEIAEDRSA